jgi:hypothetical protein
MKIYNVKIGTNTKKGIFQKHKEFFVSSNTNFEILSEAYRKKYSPLEVNISRILEVDIVEDDIVEIKTEAEKELASKTKYDSSLGINRVDIHKKDLPDWEEFFTKNKELKFSIEILEKEYIKKILNKFKIERCERINIDFFSQKVSFNFYPSWFNFNS